MLNYGGAVYDPSFIVHYTFEDSTVDRFTIID